MRSCDPVKGGHDPEKLQDFSDEIMRPSQARSEIAIRPEAISLPALAAIRGPHHALPRGAHPPICGILASAITFFHLATSALM
jgi:hypothetical protein